MNASLPVLASFQLDAQAQLQPLWTAVQELNKLDMQKENAIADMVIERNKNADKYHKLKEREHELEAELRMMDIALVEAAEEVIRIDNSRPKPTSKSKSHHSPMNKMNESHVMQSELMSPNATSFEYKIDDGVDSPDPLPSGSSYTEQNKQDSLRLENNHSSSQNNLSSTNSTPQVTRKFNNMEGARPVVTSASEIAPTYLESMGEEELDEQIAKLSKFLVKDRALVKQQQLRAQHTP